MTHRLLSFSLLLFTALSCWADEGMWPIDAIDETNWQRMREMGLELDPRQVYNSDSISLQRSIVQFGGGCTGVSVSAQGLIFTNHHCGYGAIQSQSSVEHDYLRDGFVAQGLEDELPIPGLTVKYLIETLDFTDFIEAQLAADPEALTDEERRLTKINLLCDSLREHYSNPRQAIEAQSFVSYAGNAFHIHRYQVFSDVRLAFAPPSSVGKFGGDTDNWMWPRHTGDFSVFRVYANADNAPARYAPENQPYRPAYVAPVSLEGYDRHSFAMIMGYPGSTDRYLSSWGVRQRMESINQPRIDVRGVKQAIWQQAMLNNDTIRIRYASKFMGSSNYWKNSIGMNRGIERMQVIARKQQQEQQFSQWLDAHPDKKALYGDALPLLEQGYTGSDEQCRIQTYYIESVSGMESVLFAYPIVNMLADEKNDSLNYVDRFDKHLQHFFKDYSAELDLQTTAAMLQLIREQFPEDRLPAIFRKIDKKYKGNYGKYVDQVFKRSVFPYPDKLRAALASPKKLRKDPMVELSESLMTTAYELLGAPAVSQIIQGERLFMRGWMDMHNSRNLYPDANFSMRLTYGNVDGYVPSDGVWYDYFTTVQGIFEKYQPGDHEFDVQPEIRALLASNDYGVYGDKDGTMHVNFLTNNDITGGNSGSPVFDGRGRVIGLAFDGNWEAMSGDIVFEPSVQKCIAVDVRYILFMIDRWGQCRRLIDELTIR